MSININDTPQQIIKQLTPTEINILHECGKMNISIHKNVNDETIKKKLTNNDLKNYNKSIKNLKKSGLIVIYRNKNYGLSKSGRKVAYEIVEERRKKFYEELTILSLIKTIL